MAQGEITQNKPGAAVPGEEEHVAPHSNSKSSSHLHLWDEPSVSEEDSILGKSVQRTFWLCGSRSDI